MRIGIIALLHESNTFSKQPTTLESFRDNVLLEGEQIRAALADTHHEVGGFFGGLSDAGANAVPLFAARALPSGTVRADAFDEIVRRLLRSVEEAGRLDGILVAPHGATVSEQYSDADGFWLSRLRELVGPGIPIIGTLDPHANLSPEMVESCNALIAYRTNPHLDQRDRGIDAARLILQTVNGESRPTMAALFPPLAISIERQCTDEPPLQPLYELARRQQERADILTNSVLLGFPYADVEEMGSTVVVVTNNDQALAENAVRDLATQMWNDRQRYHGDFTSVGEALDEAKTPSGPTCLLDMGDNVGGGSAADGTEILAAIHERRPGPAFVCIYDPESVAACEQAGVGSRLSLSAGGKTDSLHGSSVTLECSIVSLHNGRFEEPQPRHGGIREFDQGRTAVCKTDHELTIMFTSQRMVPFSLEQLKSCSLDPRQFRLVVAKGVNAPFAAYREVCSHFIRVNTSGSTCADLRQLTFHHRRRPMFPFEFDTAWNADSATLTTGQI